MGTQEKASLKPGNVESIRLVTAKETDSLLRSTARADTFEGLLGAYVGAAIRFPALLEHTQKLPEAKRDFRQLYNFKNCLHDIFTRQLVQFAALGLQTSPVDQAVKDMDLFDEIADQGSTSNPLLPADLAIRLCKGLPKQQKLYLLYYLHKTFFLFLEAMFFEDTVEDEVYSRAIARVNFLDTMFAFPVFGWDMLDEGPGGDALARSSVGIIRGLRGTRGECRGGGSARVSVRASSLQECGRRS